ncbi:MAG: Hsp70 family protein, partial [Planctomycetota bacterium]
YTTAANRLILAAAQRLMGQPAATLNDAAAFQALMVDPVWNQLPPSAHLLGRRRLRFDEVLRAAAQDLFVASTEGRLVVRGDAAERLPQVVSRVLMATAHPPVLKAAAPPRPTPPTSALKTPAPTPAVRPPALPASTIPSSPDEIVLGIDLGTTYSAVAYIDAMGRPTTITNAAGDLITPSVVLFDDDGAIVGKEAVAAAPLEPERVAVCVKRDMGFKEYRKAINGSRLPPEVISSVILKALLNDARRRLGPNLQKAVITVPAYFDELRRRATVDAGRIAGIEVLDIINEPTAAALAFGYQRGFLDTHGKVLGDKPMTVLVYDLGGGTFDVTIVQIHGNSFKALATDGDVSLGGKDFDEMIVLHAAQKFDEKFGEDPRKNFPCFMDMWNSAELAKKTLTERAKASIVVTLNEKRLKVDITRDEFEEMTAPLLDRTKTTTQIVLRQANLTWSQIDSVLPVGGSTRMPMIATMLTQLTGKEVDRSVSPDEAVAHGAAMYAKLLQTRADVAGSPPAAFSITNINSHSLGIIGLDTASGRRRNAILIPKNTPLPATVTRVFKTNKPNQPTVVIRVVEGESERPEACIQVGVCRIEDLPANLPQGTPVQVSYSYHESGQLEVTAQVSGAPAVRTVFQRENLLDNEQIVMWTDYVKALGS